MVDIIELDTKFTNCGICGKEIPLVNGGYAASMYEGKIEYSKRACGTPVCKECYEVRIGKDYYIEIVNNVFKSTEETKLQVI
ncbi:unnamed protein product [marine sediment metagenome]|uniref:Uncharacterized protein n=1 Tax=marine sediment metagenome TaxID=412755 RepID=X1CKN7_9ZZZZ